MTYDKKKVCVIFIWILGFIIILITFEKIHNTWLFPDFYENVTFLKVCLFTVKCLVWIINRPGVAGAVLQTALWLINSVTHWWFVEISLWRRHTLMAGDGAFSHKIDYVTIFRIF